MTKTSNQSYVRLAVSTALAGALLTGCTGGAAPTASASATKAELALAQGKGGKAVRHAEAAVLAAPRDAATRVLLGNAYLEDGRFLSAAASFGDALALGDTAPRTVISLALAQIGTGDEAAALATLDRFEDLLDPADFGLAVALAGEPQRGVYVLADAIRGGENTVKMRQNLAYAYALAGQWREARLMAAQDVAAGELGNRMAEWGALADPANTRLRVAHLLGVTVSPDAGQPAMLALGNNPGIEQLAADAATQGDAAEAPVLASAIELPPADRSDAGMPFNPADVSPGAAAFADDGVTHGTTRFVRSEVVQSLATEPALERYRPVQAAAARRTAAVPPPRAARSPNAAGAALAKGDYNIQLGAYYSMSDAHAAWTRFQRTYPQLRDARREITKARVKGKIYYRVAATGYAKPSAQSLCSAVHGKGGGCFAYAAGRPLPGTLTNGNIRVAAR